MHAIDRDISNISCIVSSQEDGKESWKYDL